MKVYDCIDLAHDCGLEFIGEAYQQMEYVFPLMFEDKIQAEKELAELRDELIEYNFAHIEIKNGHEEFIAEPLLRLEAALDIMGCRDGKKYEFSNFIEDFLKGVL